MSFRLERRTTSPSPRLRGRDKRTLLEGRGEGDSPQTPLADSPPHPALRDSRSFASAFFSKNGRRRRPVLSPQAGRGEPNIPRRFNSKQSCSPSARQQQPAS